MRMLSLLSAAALLSVVGCTSQPTGREPSSTAGKNKVEDNLQNFDFKLSSAILDADITAGEDSFLSPFSIHSALALIANGANGATATNLMGAMNLSPSDIDELNKVYMNRTGIMLNDVREFEKLEWNKSTPFTAIFANSVWYKGDIVVEKKFKTILETSYQAQFAEIKGSAEQGAAAINKWASDRTNEKVTKIIEAKVIEDRDFKMLLANAIYVKGAWTKEFQVYREPMSFQTFKGAVKVPLMTRTERSKFFENDDYVAVDLNTASNIASMTLVMPKNAKTLADFKKQKDVVFTPDFWQGLDKQMQPEQLLLSMPKFDIKYSKKLNDFLKSAGMTVAFDQAKADFKGITRSKPLHVSYVKHDSKLIVNEKGFEAAAVTSIAMATRSAIMVSKDVKIDRPFFFVIRDNKSKTLLFLGTLLNPK